MTYPPPQPGPYPPRRRGSFRFAPYAVTVGMLVAVYFVGLVVLFLSFGGLDSAQYDCTRWLCNPWEATLWIGLILIPSTIVAALISILSLVVYQGSGGRLPLAGQAALAALIGIAVSGAATALLFALLF